MLVKWIWDWNSKDPEVRKRALTGEENIVGEQRSLIKNGPLELTNYNVAQKPNVFPPRTCWLLCQSLGTVNFAESGGTREELLPLPTEHISCHFSIIRLSPHL